MDPVYAGTIAGLTILIGGFICGLGFYIYLECRAPTREQQEYSLMDIA